MHNISFKKSPSTRERPLSPHLQVYRPQLTSIMSIMHRGTGCILSLGLVFLVFWLYSMKKGSDAYAEFQVFSSLLFVRAFLYVWAFSLFYHLFNGIRHLFWDIGKGFELPQVYASGYAVWGLSLICTILFLGALR